MNQSLKQIGKDEATYISPLIVPLSIMIQDVVLASSGPSAGGKMEPVEEEDLFQD